MKRSSTPLATGVRLAVAPVPGSALGTRQSAFTTRASGAVRLASAKQSVKHRCVARLERGSRGSEGVGNACGIQSGRRGRRRRHRLRRQRLAILTAARDVVAGSEDIAHLRDAAGGASGPVVRDRGIGLGGAREKIRGFGVGMGRGQRDQPCGTAGTEKVRNIEFALAGFDGRAAGLTPSVGLGEGSGHDRIGGRIAANLNSPRAHDVDARHAG